MTSIDQVIDQVIDALQAEDREGAESIVFSNWVAFGDEEEFSTCFDSGTGTAADSILTQIEGYTL